MSASSKQTKQQLKAMAKSGAARPNCKSKTREEKLLGSALIRYTSVKSSCYDAQFHKQIQELAPTWFKPKPVTIVVSKKPSFKAPIPTGPDLLDDVVARFLNLPRPFTPIERKTTTTAESTESTDYET